MFLRPVDFFFAYCAVENQGLCEETWRHFQESSLVFLRRPTDISSCFSGVESRCVLRRSEDISCFLGCFFRTPAEISSCFYGIKQDVFKETWRHLFCSFHSFCRIVSDCFKQLLSSFSVFEGCWLSLELHLLIWTRDVKLILIL